MLSCVYPGCARIAPLTWHIRSARSAHVPRLLSVGFEVPTRTWYVPYPLICTIYVRQIDHGLSYMRTLSDQASVVVRSRTYRATCGRAANTPRIKQSTTQNKLADTREVILAILKKLHAAQLLLLRVHLISLWPTLSGMRRTGSRALKQTI